MKNPILILGGDPWHRWVQRLQVQLVKKKIPQKNQAPCRSQSSSDDDIHKGLVVKKKISPKKHAPRSFSDDEVDGRSVISKSSQFSKNSGSSNQSGTRRRGVGATKNMPLVKRFPVKKKTPLKKTPSCDPEKSEFEPVKISPVVKKKIPPKKHRLFNKSLSDDEIAKGTDVKKKILQKRHPPRSLSGSPRMNLN
jgi:hypothetical protein